jgi:hypothetical protein
LNFLIYEPFSILSSFNGLKKLTVDIRPHLQQRLRLLAVVLDRSITSIVAESIDRTLKEYESVIPEIKSVSLPD